MIDLLLNETFVRSAFPWFAAATPVLAILLCVLGFGRKRRKGPSGESTDGGTEERVRRSRAYVVAIGLLGPVVWLLWVVYESIMDKYGFASVKGLLIVLGVFVLVGLLAGWLLGRSGRVRKSE